jgi:hypothetical protein
MKGSHHEHFSEQVIDMEELFPKTESQKKPAVMYGRAIKQLKTILCNKGLKDSGEVLKNTNYGLLHFHIEAGLNDISLNKFDANKSPAVKRNSVQTRTVPIPHPIDPTSAYKDHSKFLSHEKNNRGDMHSGRLSIIHSDKSHPIKSKRGSSVLNRETSNQIEESLMVGTIIDEVPGGDL